MKIGDRVVLLMDVIHDKHHPVYGYHTKGKIGTIVNGDESTSFGVRFDNCPCGYAFHGYCDGFSALYEWLALVDEKQNNVSVCVCPSFELAFVGHNPDCPERKIKCRQ